jgi:hypothetical protein
MDTNDLENNLKCLNNEVKDAVIKRTSWMDANMEKFAKFKVGDNIYDLDRCVKVGVVYELYRYWAGRNPEYDTSMNIEYRFKTGNLINDNTSRQPLVRFGNEKQYLDELEYKFRQVKRTMENT